MKKIIVFAITISALFACSKEQAEQTKTPLLKATVETQATKGTMDSELDFYWQKDHIGLFIVKEDDSSTTNADFYTTDENVKSATFTCATDYSSGYRWNVGAFYPWQGTGLEKNNIYDGYVYFKLPVDYYDYESGQSYVPMLANLSGGSDTPTDISFKYAGGAVILNLKEVPGAANSLGMITNRKISGDDFDGIATTAAGSGSITGPEASSENGVYLHFATADANRQFKYVFPVPAIKSPTLTFKMWDKNGLVIWTASPKAQSDIGRASALVMPELTISPVPQNMYLVGWINNANVATGDSEDYAFDNKTCKLTVNLTGDNNYVCLGAKDTGKWYMTDEYVSSGKEAILECQNGDKLYVPKGNWTFTMTYQTDGSIKLTYN